MDDLDLIKKNAGLREADSSYSSEAVYEQLKFIYDANVKAGNRPERVIKMLESYVNAALDRLRDES